MLKNIQQNKPHTSRQNKINSIGAYAVAQGIKIASLPINLITVEKISKINQNLTETDIITLNQSINKFWGKSGIREKGVKLVDCKLMDTNTNTSKLKSLKQQLTDPSYATSIGKNAFFSPLTNDIVFNRKNFSTAAFHELGHAINFHNSKFLRVMQSTKIISSIITTGLSIYCALGNKELEQNENGLTRKQKTKNFIRDNAGILAAISVLPSFTEEIIASLRGYKWANQNLPKELAKKVKVTNLCSALSYTTTAIAIVLSTNISTKLKDYLYHKQ